MKHGWWILFLLPGAAWGQWAGKGSVNGVSFRYETKLEPGTHAITNVRNGLIVDKGRVAKRFLCDIGSTRCYGYDVAFEPKGADEYRMKLMALTLSDQEVRSMFPGAAAWTQVPLARPAEQTVRPGDTVAMDLFVHPSTGQKIVEYLTIVREDRMRAGTVARLRPAPALKVTGADGKPMQVVQPGKVCAVLFMLTTCGHCGIASELFSRLQAEFGGRGFQVTGVAMNPGAPVAQFAREHNLNYGVGSAPTDDSRQFLNMTSLERLLVPAVVLVDRKGGVVHQFTGDKMPDESALRGLVQGMVNAR